MRSPFQPWATALVTGIALTAACSNAADPLDPAAPQRVSAEFPAELGAANANGAATHAYDVTVTNLTSGQPFSPGVFVTHTKKAGLFAVGQAASEGIRLIAENGDPSQAAMDVPGQAGVFDVQTSGAPIHRVGGPGPTSLTVRIHARANANRLSLAVMLICTNDGFTGLDGLKLPGGFAPATYYAKAYDAGTELNDEVAGSIVPPCFLLGPVTGPAGGGARTATSEAVAPHAGIQGGADLNQALHGWDDPVAMITVQRVD